MILMGLMMFTGKMNAITGYLSEVQTAQQDNTKTEKQVPENEEKSAGDAAEKKDKAQNNDSNTKDNTDKNDDSKQGSATELPDAIDFELKDQYGNVHKLSDYKGKTVFLNFWATWCPPCRAEMPEIQKLYEEYQKEEDPEVVILGIAAPGYGQEQSADGVKQFLEENGYTYPVLMDEGGNIFDQYGIQSYPTTFMFTKEGKVFGYLSGQLSEDIMRNIIAQTISGKRETN